MAQFAGTFDSTEVAGAREDLSDMIYRVTPSDTPLLSSIGRVDATATNHEWQTHSLAAPVTNNIHTEGDEQSFSDPTPTVQVGNRTQILKKNFLISDTLEAVNLAGRSSEIAFNSVVKGLELRRDMETMLIGVNQASVGGATRQSASLNGWLATNVYSTGGYGAAGTTRGTSGGVTGFNGTVVPAATDGTVRTFTAVMLTNLIGAMFDSSGTVEDAVIHAGVTQKKTLTGFTGIATHVMTQAADLEIIATADIYASQFGRLKIVPNRYIRKTSGVDREVYVVRPSFLKLAILRNIQREELAKTGDARKFVLKVECCLQVDNEAAHGGVFDLTT